VLLNGQTVEATTHEHAHPFPQWLNYVVTAKARAGIRAYLRNIKRDDAMRCGRILLDHELHMFGVTFEQVNQDSRDNLLRSMKHASFDELFLAIGLGDRSALIVANWLCDSDGQGMTLNVNQQAASSMMIKGTEGMVVNLAKCCHPVPGDSIVGLFHRKKGIVVHMSHCNNVVEARSKQTGWLDVAWAEVLDDKTEFPVELQLAVKNSKGTLSEIAATISSMGCNIEHLSVDTENPQFSHNSFVVSVRNRQHLARLMRKLHRLDCVVKVKRRMG
jgi:GTP pyrophosphokinase/guanosine-3',5'-bis(diphosphate) 3'-pyrophosphohydrolase